MADGMTSAGFDYSTTAIAGIGLSDRLGSPRFSAADQSQLNGSA